ncbi:unnamed protein product [Rangifer tarandus platyrhynchus]|uniref:Uncharacterized protein n=1 Tax=Rangifer tarandus platyrhynchus TaxID=3082113 RepID=A0AC59YH32_RANTA
MARGRTPVVAVSSGAQALSQQPAPTVRASVRTAPTLGLLCGEDARQTLTAACGNLEWQTPDKRGFFMSRRPWGGRHSCLFLQRGNPFIEETPPGSGPFLKIPGPTPTLPSEAPHLLRNFCPWPLRKRFGRPLRKTAVVTLDALAPPPPDPPGQWGQR